MTTKAQLDFRFGDDVFHGKQPMPRRRLKTRAFYYGYHLQGASKSGAQGRRKSKMMAEFYVRVTSEEMFKKKSPPPPPLDRPPSIDAFMDAVRKAVAKEFGSGDFELFFDPSPWDWTLRILVRLNRGRGQEMLHTNYSVHEREIKMLRDPEETMRFAEMIAGLMCRRCAEALQENRYAGIPQGIADQLKKRDEYEAQKKALDSFYMNPFSSPFSTVRGVSK